MTAVGHPRTEKSRKGYDPRPRLCNATPPMTRTRVGLSSNISAKSGRIGHGDESQGRDEARAGEMFEGGLLRRIEIDRLGRAGEQEGDDAVATRRPGRQTGFAVDQHGPQLPLPGPERPTALRQVPDATNAHRQN